MQVVEKRVGNSSINFLEIISENKKQVEISDKTLRDIISGLEVGDACELAKFKLYRHQLETFEKLRDGKNVILGSDTGSGKTEAWFIYLLYLIHEKIGARALVIYPTVSLGRDQERRLSKYFTDCVKRSPLVKGPVRYDGNYDKEHDSLDDAINATIVITNPEKIARNLHSRSRLKPFDKVDFIVLDEFDFYTSSQALKLLTLLKVLYGEVLKSEVPQLVIMSATLRDSISLERLNSRETVFISGSSPKPRESHTLLYLGKENLQFLEELDKYLDGKSRDLKLRDILVRAKSLVSLRENTTSYKIYLKSLAEDEGLTFLFTNYITEAERLYYELNPKDMDNRIAIHHSLRKDPGNIIQRVSENEIKLLISVKTLGQGVNFKAAKRVVHYGLPDHIKEFIQREGRKGRDPDLSFVESVIFPRSISDLVPFLGDNPEQTFTNWKELGPENIILSYDSDLSRFFEEKFALAVRKGKLGKEITLQEVKEDEDIQELRDLGLIRFHRIGSTKTPDLRRRKVYASFYTLETKKEAEIILDDPDIKSQKFSGSVSRISYEKMVRYYQPGAIDYSLGAIVESIEKEKDEKGKITFVVKEVPTRLLENLDYSKERGTSPVLERLVERFKRLQKDTEELRKTSIQELIQTGRLVSRIVTRIFIEDNESGGLVRYREVPWRVMWQIYLLNYSIKLILVELKSKMYLKGMTYAYAIPYDKSSAHEEKYISILRVALRRQLGVPLDTIMYSKTQSNDKREEMLTLWETEITGILPVLFENKTIMKGRMRITREDLINAIRDLKYDDQTKILLRINQFKYGFPPVKEQEFDSIKRDAIEYLNQLRSAYVEYSMVKKIKELLNQSKLDYIRIVIPLDDTGRHLLISEDEFSVFNNVNEVIQKVKDESDKNIPIYAPRGPSFPVLLCRYPKVIPIDLGKVLEEMGIVNGRERPHEYLAKLLDGDVKELERFIIHLISNLDIIKVKEDITPSALCITMMDSKTWNRIKGKKSISFTLDSKPTADNAVYMEHLNAFNGNSRRKLLQLYANGGKLYNFFVNENNQIVGFGLIDSVRPKVRDKCDFHAPKFSSIDFELMYDLPENVQFFYSDNGLDEIRTHVNKLLSLRPSDDKVHFGVYCGKLESDGLRDAFSFLTEKLKIYMSSQINAESDMLAEQDVQKGIICDPLKRLQSDHTKVTESDFEEQFHYFVILDKLSGVMNPEKNIDIVRNTDMVRINDTGVICSNKGKLVVFKIPQGNGNLIERAGLEYYKGTNLKIPTINFKYLVGGSGKMTVIKDISKLTIEIREEELKATISQLISSDLTIYRLVTHLNMLSHYMEKIYNVPKSEAFDDTRSYLNNLMNLASKLDGLIKAIESELAFIRKEYGVDLKVELHEDKDKLIKKIVTGIRTTGWEKFLKSMESKGTEVTKAMGSYVVKGKGIWLSNSIFYALPGTISINNVEQELQEVIQVETPSLVKFETI
ncbi:ATP-dependent RNA helicase RhlB [Metallosphaera sp. J1]|uniref:DEAD/DEAH box helicase n=1 Tax=Metallosphaera javensis (ex Hofmann et al. 2022) TaxID=99938 RepID=UPI001EE0E4A6|nr:DEAD/DEAH box helicase [Metallosphaera javensis (ex Hofmann et al. 2022)]MCG3110067.1 ATP-dependent RNA helicase RhlB [Metallosphaera javensis (ex Hofmann et al. 2022)]